MKKILVVFVPLLVLAACNTVQGLGKDVQKAGQVVENAAKK